MPIDSVEWAEWQNRIRRGFQEAAVERCERPHCDAVVVSDEQPILREMPNRWVELVAEEERRGK